MPEPDHVVYGIKVERVRKGVLSFVDLMGEFLSPARRSIYERILDAIPEMTDLRGRKRLTEGGNLTLIHEDAHLGNIFFPYDPETYDPFLIDWQTRGVQVGTNDLAYIILSGLVS
jgi:Ser/Thr protein kinase RdoA (MazF antagonist)